VPAAAAVPLPPAPLKELEIVALVAMRLQRYL
jgi:hypothetical protein